MNFKLDENLPAEIADLLRQAGHDVKTVLEEGLEGSNDTAVLDACVAEDRALVSLDTDFGDIRAYPPSDLPGIIVLRLRSQARGRLLKVFKNVLPFLAVEPLKRHLWIVEDGRIRIHGRDA